MPQVTVIIPAYNAIDYLPDAVKSALAQTFSDLEIIVINDGSSDDTEQWLQQQNHPKLTFISQSNRGKSAARNTGIAKAKGEYLAFLDADDLWESTKLAKQVKCLNGNPQQGLVYTWTALADRDGRPTGRVITPEAKGDVWEQLIQANILTCGSTPMVRKVCFDTVGLFADDLPLAQDWDMWLRIAAFYPFAVIKEPLVYYRQHPTNTSKNLEAMHRCNTLVLERALQAKPTNITSIKAKAYHSLHLYLGWIAVQNCNHKQALFFWKKACSYSLKLVFSQESVRLLASVLAIRFLGLQFYQSLIKLNRILRGRQQSNLS